MMNLNVMYWGGGGWSSTRLYVGGESQLMTNDEPQCDVRIEEEEEDDHPHFGMYVVMLNINVM